MFILKYTRFIFALFTLIVGIQYSAWSNPVNDPPADTTEGKPIRKVLTKDSAEQYSNYLLTTHPTYLDHWINDVTFVFDDFKYEHLPEEIVLPLVTGDEQFTMTWYGRITSTYKRRWGRQHHGLDIGLRTGDTVLAAFDGIVRYAQFNKSGFGNCIVIRHLNGLETVYAHLSKIDVQPNQFVTSGQSIGLGGNTGHSFGPHLHFETRYKDFSFDPELYIDVKTQSLKTDTLFLTPKSFTAYKHLEERKQKTAKTKETPESTVTNHSLVDSTQSIAVNIQTPVVETQPSPTSANTSKPSNKPSTATSNNTADTKTNTPAPASTAEKAPTAKQASGSTTAKSTKSTAPTTTKTKPIASAKTTNKKGAIATKGSKTPATAATKKPTTAKSATNKTAPVVTKPKPTPVKKSGKSYTIVSGDNLTVISKKTGVPIQKIRKLNVIKADNKLMPGQTLRLN
jgi:LysM repeat protein